MLGLSKRNIINLFSSVVVVLALTFSVGFHFAPTAYAAPAADPTTPVTDPATAPTGGNADAKVTGENCAVEKIGWIVCPLMEQAAKISDKAFQVLADNFLRTDPELISNQSGTKDAWEISRNVANIMFIIAFLIIIVSQVTGMGITNYGLKKMIPRLLVAAVLVNVSYYICQLMVDITNILGYQIEEALSQIANTIGPSVFGQASQLGAANVGNGLGTTATVIVEIALAGALIVWLIMGPMMAVIAMILITAITIVIVLLLRKALIVLLIVAAPIAFVMYLLPNTEKIFDKWKDMFIKVLMLFPVIGLLFGAGQLASTVILVAGAQSQTQAETAKNCNPDDIQQKKDFNKNSTNSYDSCGMGSVVLTGTSTGETGPTCNAGKGAGCKLAIGLMQGLVALGVAITPLIATWSVLKGALSAAGSVGGKIQATITKGGGNITKRAQANDEARQNRMALRALHGEGPPGVKGVYRRRNLKDRNRKDVSKLLDRQSQAAARTDRGGDFSDAAGGTMFGRANSGDMQYLSNVSAAEAEKLHHEQQSGAQRQMRDMTAAQQEEIMMGGTVNGLGGEVAQEAAIFKAASEQNVEALHRAMLHAFRTGSEDMQRMISSAIQENYAGVKAKAGFMVDQGFTDSMREGRGSEDGMRAAIRDSMRMGEGQLSTQNNAMLGLMQGELANATSEQVNALKETSERLQSNTTAFGSLNSTGAGLVNGFAGMPRR